MTAYDLQFAIAQSAVSALFVRIMVSYTSTSVNRCELNEVHKRRKNVIEILFYSNFVLMKYV